MKYFLFLFLLCPLVALGSGDDIEQETIVDVVTGDVSVVGGKSSGLGFGRSSFDVDINQCMGSTAWDTIIGGRQKLVINWVCLAEFYLKTGQPKLAAVAICNTEMVSEFDSEAACEQAHDFFVEIAEAIVVESSVIEVVDDQHREEEEEWHEEQMQMQHDYDERIDRLEARLNRPPPVDKDAARRAASRASLSEFQKGVPEK